MTSEEAKIYHMIPPGITDTTLVQCPSCNVFSSLKEWRVIEPYCELCGSHDGMECPACEKMFDVVDCHEAFATKEQEIA